MHYSSIILAADAPIFDTEIGKIIKAFLAALALLILIAGAFKTFSSITSGKPGQAAKVFISTAVVCAFLFNPALFGDLISFMSNIVDAVIGSGEKIATDAKNSTAPTPTTVPVK
jgi:hypothetical protein